MKKFIALLLALAMLCGMAFAETVEIDEDAELTEVEGFDQEVDGELTAASTTKAQGKFFTEMWGNNTVDDDVRELLHGYALTRFDQENGMFVADDSVVTALVVTDAANGDRTYTISLADDLYYSDGTKITAADYCFSLLFSMSPEVEKLGASVNGYDYIIGATDYRMGLSTVIPGIRLINDMMFSVTVSGEYLPFFYELGLLRVSPYPISVIAPECVVKDYGEGIGIYNIDEEIEEPIFTAELLMETVMDPETGYQSHPSVNCGPYTLTSFDGVTMEFDYNEYYKGTYDGRVPYIAHLTYTNDLNENLVTKLSEGEYGLINKGVKKETIEEGMKLVSEDDFLMSNYARCGYAFINYCCEDEKMASPLFRKALAHLMMRDELIEAYTGSYGVAVNGYYGIGQWMVQLINGTMPPPVDLPADPTAEEQAAYDAEMAAWDELSLDELTTYEFSIDTALSLIIEDGWIFNENGDPFDPEVDTLRYKDFEGTLVPMQLLLYYPEGNQIGEYLVPCFADNIAQVGGELTLTPVEFTELQANYYRQVERECDMIFHATNFYIVYDPSDEYMNDEEYKDVANSAALEDNGIYAKTVDMRKTEPGEVLTYCQRWLEFQKEWSEELPCMPLYSNVYFDFYEDDLHDYNIASSATWANAIVGAYLSDYVEEEPEEEDLEDETDDDGLVEFED